MSSNIVVAAEIHDLIQRVQRGKGNGFSLHSLEPGSPLPAARRPYYAPSLLMSEPQPPSRTNLDRDLASITSGVTALSTVFDMLDVQSMRSESTAPPRRGPEPRHRQRALVPDFAPTWLPCEFRRLSGCAQRFRLQHVERWIEHIVDEHLHGMLPGYSICWFCNDAKFQILEGQPQGLNDVFQRRMHHIAEHFRAGKTAVDIRWDFHFLDHVHDHNLISKEVFRWAKGQFEIPMPRDVTFDAEDVTSRLRTTYQGQLLETSRDPRQAYRSRRSAED